LNPNQRQRSWAPASEQNPLTRPTTESAIDPYHDLLPTIALSTLRGEPPRPLTIRTPIFC
jgi:hypothetical protein